MEHYLALALFLMLRLAGLPDYLPQLHLDKTVFSPEEELCVEVGSIALPALFFPASDIRSDCQLIIRHPDGVQEILKGGPQLLVARSWPSPPPLLDSWSDRRHLRLLSPGTYTLQFQVGALKTLPRTLVVKPLPVMKDISVRFECDESQEVRSCGFIGATLVVANQSAEKLRLEWPPRDGLAFECNAYVEPKDGRPFPYWYWFHSLDTFGKQSTTIELAPGQAFKKHYRLGEADGEHPARVFPCPGTYAVKFETTVAFRVGKADGPFAEWSTVRLPVTITGKFTLKRSPAEFP